MGVKKLGPYGSPGWGPVVSERGPLGGPDWGVPVLYRPKKEANNVKN